MIKSIKKIINYRTYKAFKPFFLENYVKTNAELNAIYSLKKNRAKLEEKDCQKFRIFDRKYMGSTKF